MKESMEDVAERIQILDGRLKDVRFSDDHGMITNTEMGLQGIIDRLHEIRQRNMT